MENYRQFLFQTMLCPKEPVQMNYYPLFQNQPYFPQYQPNFYFQFFQMLSQFQPVLMQKEEEKEKNENSGEKDSSEKIKYSIVKSDKRKLFVCNYKNCSKKYKSKENLILHYKSKHLSLKPYHCGYCSVSFSHRNGKTYHERKVHTLIFPHHCSHPDCEMKFASKSALIYHMNHQH